MPLTPEEITKIAKATADAIVKKKALTCDTALILVEIIEKTTLVEEMFSGMCVNQDIKSLRFPIPAEYPVLANVVKEFNQQLGSIQDPLTIKGSRDVINLAAAIKGEAREFLLPSVIKCIFGKGKGEE